MRSVRLRLKLRMILAGEEPRMIPQLDQFDQGAVGGSSRDDETGVRHLSPVIIIEFEAMSMPLSNYGAAIESERLCAFDQVAVLRTQTHGRALLLHFFLLRQDIDDWMRALGVELRRIRALQSAHVTGKLDGRDLHPQAKPEVRKLVLTGKLGRADLAFDAALAETARHKDAGDVSQFV